MINGGLGNITTGLDLPVFDTGLDVTVNLSEADGDGGTVYLGSSLASLGGLGIDDIIGTAGTDVNLNLGFLGNGFDIQQLPMFGDLNQDGLIDLSEDNAFNVEINISSEDAEGLDFITNSSPGELREFFTHLGHSGIDVVNFMDQGAFDSFANILQGNDPNESFEFAVNSSGQDFRSVEVKIIGGSASEDPTDVDGNPRT